MVVAIVFFSSAVDEEDGMRESHVAISSSGGFEGLKMSICWVVVVVVDEEEEGSVRDHN